MSNITEKDPILDWCQELVNTHLPRWNELPDIELYMDQVITIIERYLAVFAADSHDKIITAAMINNYVKLGIIPKPEKKRYGRIHLAYLLVIAILKQVITITEIKDGIFLQSRLHGEKQAYNDFCEAQEQAFLIAANAIESTMKTDTVFPAKPIAVSKDTLALYMATTSFATRIVTEKLVQMRLQELSQENDAAVKD